MSSVKFKVFTVLISVMVFGGCYASSTAHGDGASDPAVDPAADPSQDPAVDRDVYQDPQPDRPPDPPPPEIIQDIPAEIPPVCEPAAGASVSFTVWGGPYGDPPYDLERDCIVAWMSWGTPIGLEIDLNCTTSSGESELYYIAVSSDPGIAIFVPEGTPVTFGYMVEQPWWQDRWFFIRYGEGPLLMAGVDADSLIRGDVDPDYWYEPLIVRPVEGLCPPVPEECGDAERLAIDVTFESMVTRIFDGNDSYVGFMQMYQVIVDQAVVHHDMTCDDFPESWFTALFVSLPVR